MPGDGTEPIDDDEILYRRIPVSRNFYSAATKELSPGAFEPHIKNDDTGLSITRAKYRSIEDAARGLSKSGYWIARFRAGDLRAHGIELSPRPTDEDKGHSEITSLTNKNYESKQSQDMMLKLATELCLGVQGPYSHNATLPPETRPT